MVTVASQRTQVFLPISEFGDGWDGLALVVEGFTRRPGWVSWMGDVKGVMTERRGDTAAVGVLIPKDCRGEVIQAVAEEGWFNLLGRALVGRIGEVGVKRVGFATMTDWVGQWWQRLRKVEI